jgi:hypothetical protein
MHEGEHGLTAASGTLRDRAEVSVTGWQRTLDRTGTELAGDRAGPQRSRRRDRQSAASPGLCDAPSRVSWRPSSSTTADSATAAAAPAATASASASAGAASASSLTRPHWTCPGETSADG